MEKHKKKTQRNSDNIWVNSAISGGIGLGVMLLCAFLMPILLINTGDPKVFVVPGAIICCVMGGGISGIMAARGSKDVKLQSALISALIILVPMILASFVYKKGFDILWFLIIIAVVAISAASGALLVMKTASNKKRNMKKAMKRR